MFISIKNIIKLCLFFYESTFALIVLLNFLHIYTNVFMLHINYDKKSHALIQSNLYRLNSRVKINCNKVRK